MSKLVLTRRNFKKRFPRLATMFNNGRFLRDFKRTVRMLDQLQGLEDAQPAPSNGKKVVFNLVRTYSPFQVTIEVMLALKLRSRGYDVTLLYDDGVLRHHEILTMNDHKPFKPYYSYPLKASVRMLSQVPVINQMLEPYTRYVESEDTERIAGLVEENRTTCEDIDLNPYIKSSVVRFFLSAPDRSLLESEPEYQHAYEMFLENCHASLTVARNVYKRLKPDLLVTSHGIYTTWGPFMQYMVNRGVRSVTWAANGFTTNGVDIAVNGVAANKSDNGFLDHIADTKGEDSFLTDEVLEKVDQFMNSRSSGTASDIARLRTAGNGDEENAITRVRQFLTHGKRVFGLFPNVMWDNAVTSPESNRLFESPVEWLVETVRYFASSEDKALVVRVHPAEHTWMPVRKSIVDILRFHLGDEILNHENILIIRADQRLSSYSLFEYLSGGIVYNGTIGPEMIYRRMPVIIGAKAAYSDKGFTFDITGRVQYFASFDRTEDILRAQNSGHKRVKIFLYERLFLHGVPVQFISSSRQFSPNIEGEPVQMWQDENLEHIIATMVGEREFIQEYATSAVMA